MTVRVDELLHEVERLAAETREAVGRGEPRDADPAARPGVTGDRPGAPGSSRAGRSPTRSATAVAEDVASFTGRARPSAGPARRHRRARTRRRRSTSSGSCAAAPRSASTAGFVELEGEATEASVRADGPRAQRRPDGRRGHRPDAAAADDPAARRSSTRSTRPRTSTASTRSTPASCASATTGSCRRPRTPPSRSCAGPGIEIAGRDAVVVGRSAVVGMPAAFLLVKEDATVTVCHSRTRDLAGHVRRADIVVVAAGRPGPRHRRDAQAGRGRRRRRDQRRRRPASSATSTSRRRSTVASAITPVPGGVGPLTNALLLTHLIRAAERQAPRARPTSAPDRRPVRRRPMSFPSDLEIARSVTPRPIVDVARELGHRATTSSSCTGRRRPRSRSRRSSASRRSGRAASTSLVTAITPDAARRGQVDDDGRARAGAQPDRPARRRSASASHRSGPVFGIKGGAAGGGYSQVIPMEDFNLHLTGDVHAIGAAHNLAGGVPRQQPPPQEPARASTRTGSSGRASSTSATGRCATSSSASAAARTASRARPSSSSPSAPRSWPSSPSRPTSWTCGRGSGGSSWRRRADGTAGHRRGPRGRRAR